ncbi:MAG: dihydrodipicolinate synthase family protein [Sedimentisphaerales bacterium]|nr:dihydrodipicolinate synthase family protein [Sedimentisphaerales bacterium]
MKQHLTDLIAAPHTPMLPDGRVNLEIVEKQAQCLIENGVKAAFVCGSTGEGISLTTAERMQLVERWKDVVGQTIPIIVQVGHHSLADARILAEHAQNKAAAWAIASLAPSYFKPKRIEDLVAFCAEIAAAVPHTPFYYYHQPTYSGVSFPMPRFISIAAEKIPTFAGLKYSDGDMMDFGRCLDFSAGRFDVLFGIDEMLLAAFALGARGAIGSTYNFAAPLYHGIIDAFEAGDMAAAQAGQARARELVTVLKEFGSIPAIKAAMKAVGIDCGPCRLPLRTLSDSQYEDFRDRLDKIGFFTYCSKLSS